MVLQPGNELGQDTLRCLLVREMANPFQNPQLRVGHVGDDSFDSGAWNPAVLRPRQYEGGHGEAGQEGLDALWIPLGQKTQHGADVGRISGQPPIDRCRLRGNARAGGFQKGLRDEGPAEEGRQFGDAIGPEKRSDEFLQEGRSRARWAGERGRQEGAAFGLDRFLRDKTYGHRGACRMGDDPRRLDCDGVQETSDCGGHFDGSRPLRRQGRRECVAREIRGHDTEGLREARQDTGPGVGRTGRTVQQEKIRSVTGELDVETHVPGGDESGQMTIGPVVAVGLPTESFGFEAVQSETLRVRG